LSEEALSLKEPFYVRKALEKLEKGEEALCIKSLLFSKTVRRITGIFTGLDRFLTAGGEITTSITNNFKKVHHSSSIDRNAYFHPNLYYCYHCR
jgi:hypothetical protein